MKTRIASLLLLAILAGNLTAQTVIIDRPPAGGTSDQFSVLSAEGNRFGNFESSNPTDFFVLEQETTLETIEIYADVNDGFSWSDTCRPGMTLHILNDDNGQPSGFPFDTQGEFGSDGVVYLEDMREDDGAFEFISPAPSVRINLTVANGGQPITLPAGAYWLSVVNRSTCQTIGEQGHYRWRQSAIPSGNDVYFCRSLYNFNNGNNEWFTLQDAISSNLTFDTISLGGSMAWQMTGTPVEVTLLGDVNMDGEINLLDVAPFVDRLANNEYQAEADINEDGLVNLLDVGPFVDLLAN